MHHPWPIARTRKMCYMRCDLQRVIGASWARLKRQAGGRWTAKALRSASPAAFAHRNQDRQGVWLDRDDQRQRLIGRWIDDAFGHQLMDDARRITVELVLQRRFPADPNLTSKAINQAAVIQVSLHAA